MELLSRDSISYTVGNRRGSAARLLPRLTMRRGKLREVSDYLVLRKNQGLDRLHRETSRHSAFTEEASTQWGRLFSDSQVKKKTLHTDGTSREAVVCIRACHRVMDRHSCLLPRNGITSSFCCCLSPLVL